MLSCIQQWLPSFLQRLKLAYSRENMSVLTFLRSLTILKMALLKGEGHSIYILKAQMYQDLPERSTNVVFFQKPDISCFNVQLVEQMPPSLLSQLSRKVEGL